MTGAFHVMVEEFHHWPRSRTQPARKESSLLVADMSRPAEHAIQGVCKLLLDEEDAHARWGTLKDKTVIIAVTGILMGGELPILRGKIVKVPLAPGAGGQGT